MGLCSCTPLCCISHEAVLHSNKSKSKKSKSKKYNHFDVDQVFTGYCSLLSCIQLIIIITFCNWRWIIIPILNCLIGTLEGHHTQFIRRLGSPTYSNDKRKSLKCITFQMCTYSIRQGTWHEVVKHHAINWRKMNGWRAKNHSVESELSTFIAI